MAVVKIKRSRNGDPSVDTSSPSSVKKKIKIKTKLNGETSNTATPQPRIKINLKKDNKSKMVEKTGTMKVKLSMKKKDENGNKMKRHEPRVRVKAIRLPGEGYDSEDSDVETDPLIESGIILRVVPDTQVDFVKNSIEAGDYSGISVQWLSERHAVVTINGYMYGAILVDLPTIIEVNKSVDRKNLLKTFDVCQMLLCIKTISSPEEVFDLQAPDTGDVISNHYEDIIDEINKEKTTLMRHQMHNGSNHINSAELNKIATKGYDFNHGLTAPLYNVRNRRFRRKMNPVEFEYVESAVESLLNDDDKAEESVFELITEEEINTKPLPLTTHSQVNLVPQQQQQQIISASSKETSLSLPLSSTPALGVPVSSTPGLPRENTESYTAAEEEEEEEDEDLDLEAAFESEEDEGDENKNTADVENVTEPKSGTEDLFDESGGEDEESDEDESDEDEDEDEDGENDGSRGTKDEKRQHIELLADELKELQTILLQTRRKVAKATNPLLKSRFLDSIKKLEKEVELKKKQLGSLQPEINSDGASVPVDQQQIPQQQQVNAADEEEDEEEDMDEEEEESAEDEDDEERQDHPESPENAENPLDQNDLDMMMLFGAEAEEDED